MQVSTLESRVSSIEHNSGIARYERNYGIDQALVDMQRTDLRHTQLT